MFERIIPRSMAARTIAVMVIGLTLSHFASIAAYRVDLLEQTDGAVEQGAAERIAAVRAAILKAPAEERERTASLLSGRKFDAHWSNKATLETDMPVDASLSALRERLLDAAPDLRDYPFRLAYVGDPDHAGGGARIVIVSAQSPDGAWFNLRYIIEGPASHSSDGVLLSTIVMVLAVVALSVPLIRSATEPLKAMARAAERLGVDVTAPPLPETGPSEVRQAAHAFNEMQGRIKRLLTDRTQMLAALSHDLRTPLTVIRLRAEFIEDEEQYDKMMTDIDEMEGMIATTLAFLRDDATQEETEIIDLASTLSTICGTLSDAGRHAEYSGERHAPLRCRPVTIKRAFMNLVGNAVKYGVRASVVLSVGDGRIRVDIYDEGPGIPEAEMERVFNPFYRVEPSRNRETGGFGLGLTIARGAIRAHGGDIELANRPEGGLQATVILPWVKC